MTILNSDRPVLTFMPEGIAITIIKSASVDKPALALPRGVLSKVRPQIASLALFRTLILALALLCSASAYAQTQDTDIRPFANQLDGAQIKATFSGVTMDGAYNFGRNGKAQSFYVEDHRADGTLAYEEDGEHEPGRWFVRKNTLCFTYPSKRLSGGCFRVYQVKNCFYFYSSQLVARERELDTNFWTARSVRKGEAPNCVAAIS